jgi:2-polyprenyl-3-methyl-5-hydroxy-6-metoxy-1,4-benzoquinol methylase
MDFKRPLRPLVRAAFAAQHGIWMWLKPVRRGARIVRHIATYRAPDEVVRCPACDAPRPVPLRPIPLDGRAHGYGYASGCVRCGVVFANPLPSAQAVAEVYTAEGAWGRHRQDEQEKQVTEGRLALLFAPLAPSFDVLRPPRGASVLDVGCGLGGLLDAFAAAGWRTTGIEPAVKGAFARHEELSEIPTQPRFDVAVLHHVLEHVTNPLEILRQLSKAVVPGGYLLIKVPNLDDVGQHGDMKYCIRAGVHVLAYTSACLAWLAHEAGFEVVSDRRSLDGTMLRHRTVLARRVDGGARPGAPLTAARQAFARYAAAHEPSAFARWLPVRIQSALRDLERLEYRV